VLQEAIRRGLLSELTSAGQRATQNQRQGSEDNFFIQRLLLQQQQQHQQQDQK